MGDRLLQPGETDATSAADPEFWRHEPRHTQRYWLAGTSGLLFAVDVPPNAILVNEYAETKRPKCFLERHVNRSILCQRIENALGFNWITEIEL